MNNEQTLKKPAIPAGTTTAVASELANRRKARAERRTQRRRKLKTKT